MCRNEAAVYPSHQYYDNAIIKITRETDILYFYENIISGNEHISMYQWARQNSAHWK